MPCSPRIIGEMLLEIHTMEKCDFLKPILKLFTSLLSATRVCKVHLFSKA